MTARSLLLTSAAVALLALLVVGLLQLHGSSSAPPAERLTVAQMRAQLAGSPAPLAGLHAQAGEILPGGLAALRRRLAALHGEPLVINKWASWCQPCRAEFGVFQRVSVAQGRTVAFVGIDSGDTSAASARGFMRSVPVSFPSYYDQSGAAGAAVTDSSFTSVTVFYNRSGSQYIHQGPYPSVAKLEQDIRRYALDG